MAFNLMKPELKNVSAELGKRLQVLIAGEFATDIYEAGLEYKVADALYLTNGKLTNVPNDMITHARVTKAPSEGDLFLNFYI